MSRKVTLLACLAILAAGAGVTAVVFSTEPTAERGGATKQSAMLVEVTAVEGGTFRPTIQAMGTVQASQDIVLSPRVAGEIVSIAESFTPGGFVREGRTLLQLDPSDYENALQQRRSELRQALSDLAIEEGRREVARADYELLDETIPAENEALVLREPQLEHARSRVESARAAVKQAELHLARTTIRAPFDAHVLSRDANVGSQVAPGDRIGRLVGLDEYWVVATVPLSKLKWLSLRSGGQEGSAVRIRDRTAWPRGPFREGRLDRLIGAVEDQTRMARVIVSVEDPLAYRSDDPDLPPLMIGSFVEASIEAEELPEVIRLDRDYLRQDDTVWVMEDDELRIRDVAVVLRDAQHAYVSAGLGADDRVVTTNLATVTEGAPLRVEGDGEAAGQEPGEAAARSTPES